MTQLTPLFISDDFVSWYLQAMKKTHLSFLSFPCQLVIRKLNDLLEKIRTFQPLK